MPECLDEDVTFAVELDQHREPEKRRRFIFMHRCVRDHLKAGKLYDQAESAKTTAELVDLLEASAVIDMVGWENCRDRDGNPVPFDPAKLGDVVTLHNLATIAASVPREQLRDYDRRWPRKPAPPAAVEQAPPAVAEAK